MKHLNTKSLHQYNLSRVKEWQFRTGRDCEKCRSCFRVTEYDVILQLLRLCKGEFSVIDSLRRIVHQHGSGIPASRLDENQLLKQAAWLLSSGVVHLCVPKEHGDTSEQAEEEIAGPVKLIIDRIVASLRTTTQDVVFEGARFRIVGTEEWSKLKSDDFYQVVPQEQAKKTLEKMATRVGLQPSEKAALKEAIPLVPETSGGRFPGGILLLRQVPKSVPRSTKVEEVPPIVRQTKEQTVPPRDLHWIKIQLVDEEGIGIQNEGFLIVAPDKREFRGTTDAGGWARVDGIVEGQCKICFTKLDMDCWESA